MSIAYNITEKNVSMVLDGKPHIIPVSSGVYSKVLEAIMNKDEAALRALVAPKAHIATFTEGRISFDGRELSFNGETIHNSIKDRLHFLWSNSLDLSPLMRFLDNLMDNPSYRAVNETYGFLEACDLPITNDGHFLAYKMVRGDYLDIYSGTMRNDVGLTVGVPRNMVDEDSERTCSYGLHVCSQDYLGCYGSSGRSDRVLIVKVNPADVVAVPADYNNAKMRVCEYEVVGECSWDEVGLDRYHTNSYSSVNIDDWDESYEDEYDSSWDEDYESSLDTLEDDWTPVSAPEPDSGTSNTVSVPTATVPPNPVNGKLTLAQVQDIKRLLADHEMAIVNIARLHGVNESTVRKIRDGKIHRDVSI